MHVADQVMIIWAGTKGYLDKVDRPKAREWEEAFLRYMHEQQAPVRDALVKSRKMTPEIEKQLTAAAEAFVAQYHPAPASRIEAVAAGTPPEGETGVKTEGQTTGVARAH
jgi:F-type H+-transporting ATPase subunit alpha